MILQWGVFPFLIFSRKKQEMQKTQIYVFLQLGLSIRYWCMHLATSLKWSRNRNSEMHLQCTIGFFFLFYSHCLPLYLVAPTWTNNMPIPVTFETLIRSPEFPSILYTCQRCQHTLYFRSTSSELQGGLAQNPLYQAHTIYCCTWLPLV